MRATCCRIGQKPGKPCRTWHQQSTFVCLVGWFVVCVEALPPSRANMGHHFWAGWFCFYGLLRIYPRSLVWSFLLGKKSNCAQLLSQPFSLPFSSPPVHNEHLLGLLFQATSKQTNPSPCLAGSELGTIQATWIPPMLWTRPPVVPVFAFC